MSQETCLWGFKTDNNQTTDARHLSVVRSQFNQYVSTNFEVNYNDADQFMDVQAGLQQMVLLYVSEKQRKYGN